MTSNAVHVVKDVSQTKAKKSKREENKGDWKEWMQFTGCGEKEERGRRLKPEDGEGEKI